MLSKVGLAHFIEEMDSYQEIDKEMLSLNNWVFKTDDPS